MKLQKRIQYRYSISYNLYYYALQKSFQQKLVSAVNNLVEKDELVAWSRMQEERRDHTITKLLHTVEESALKLASNYKTPTELEIKATDMGEMNINTELSYRNSKYIKLPCHLFSFVGIDLISNFRISFLNRIKALHFRCSSHKS